MGGPTVDDRRVARTVPNMWRAGPQDATHGSEADLPRRRLDSDILPGPQGQQVSVVTRGPKGFKCGCGQWHEFAIWVYAHWDILITHKCDQCGRVHDIMQGRASQTRGPHRTKRKAPR